MSTHSCIDLSKLNAPQIIATPESEQLFQSMLAELQKQLPDFDATVESEPALKILQAVAYCAERMRYDVNHAGQQVMLAFASGSNLDHLGALVGVKRFLMTPEDTTSIPPTPAVFEGDENFRQRIQKAPESFTTAGSRESYEFHAKAAHADVLDVSVESPTPGVITACVLSMKDNGTPSLDLIKRVEQALSSDEVRPLSDCVKVIKPEIIEFAVDAHLIIKPGADAAIVIDDAKSKLNNYIAKQFRLGYPIALSKIYACFANDNIIRAEIKNPAHDLVLNSNQAPRCTAIKFSIEVSE